MSLRKISIYTAVSSMIEETMGNISDISSFCSEI